MDQARSTISKIFNGEPHSYTRFNLTQNMEGDNSQVEMKLSSDMDEEAGGNGVGEHLNHNSNRKPYVAKRFGRTPKNLCFMAATVFLIFLIGYFIGYLIHQRKDSPPSCAATAVTYEDDGTYEPVATPIMKWSNVKNLFAEKLSVPNFIIAFSEFSSFNHQAGSQGDDTLGDQVITKFRGYGMKTWTDRHFIKVQELPASTFNKLTFKNDNEERLEGILSYSDTGRVSGAILYAHYGRDEDFKLLQNRKISLSGRIMLIRAGGISFAEKVANAAKVNASAVLIYADPTDYRIEYTAQLFGHVHLGSGDPYTPGFPSFNHTQFPPVQSSGLPNILAQTIPVRIATSMLNRLEGENMPAEWGYRKLGGASDVATLEVNNVLKEKKINNVFGLIKGFVDADRYVVIGAQRDAWGPGFASSTIGTTVLVELARVISNMVKNDGFKPRRSIVFASWTGGEYGNIGATEWLESYPSSLSMKAFAYINLDGIVTGNNGFKVAASPLLHNLIERTLKEVNMPTESVSLHSKFGKNNWESNVLEPLKLDNAAYSFLAFSGIPSVSFRFTNGNSDYPYFGTLLDTQEKLNSATSNQCPQVTVAAARFAGHLALRLVHDYLLPMNVKSYNKMIGSNLVQISEKVMAIKRVQPQVLPKTLSMEWLISASGSYSVLASKLLEDIQNSDLEDIEMCRILNDRIMAVERNLLSPYVSPIESPFRHILHGYGPHTLKGISSHLDALSIDHPEADANQFRKQFALATWTIQGCANSIAGNIWSVDNEI